MGKVWTYVVLSLGLMLLLQFSGLPNGAMGELFTLVGVNFGADNTIQAATATSTGFFNNIFGTDDLSIKGILITLAASIGAVVVGLFAKAQVENLILLPFITGTLVLFVSSYLAIINYTIGLGVPWVSALVSVIFIPIMFGFIVSLLEFFRGTD